MNVIFCASEVAPFAKTGGLADVCGSLPLALERNGIHVTIFLPHYKTIDASVARTTVAPNVSKATIGKDIDVYFVQNFRCLP